MKHLIYISLGIWLFIVLQNSGSLPLSFLIKDSKVWIDPALDLKTMGSQTVLVWFMIKIKI